MAEPKTAKQAEKAVGGATREFAEQGASFAREAADKTKTTARETSIVTSEVASAWLSGALEFNRELLEVIRANTNASFDLAHQLIEAKSASMVIELTAEHARKQVDAFREQTQHLASLAQKITIDAVSPVQTGMKSFFQKAA